MNFKYKDCNGNVLPVNCEVGKIVIYGNGNEQYGAYLTHWSGHGNPINLDIGALQALIDYYKHVGPAT